MMMELLQRPVWYALVLLVEDCQLAHSMFFEVGRRWEDSEVMYLKRIMHFDLVYSNTLTWMSFLVIFSHFSSPGLLWLPLEELDLKECLK